MLLDLAQGDHGPEGKLLVRLLDGVKAEAAQVDGGGDVEVLHLEPEHPAQDAGAALLVQLPGFLEGLGLDIGLDLDHRRSFSFLFSAGTRQNVHTFLL